MTGDDWRDNFCRGRSESIRIPDRRAHAPTANLDKVLLIVSHTGSEAAMTEAGGGDGRGRPFEVGQRRD